MSKKDVHVVPHDDGWATRRPGADRVSSQHGTQGEAIDRATEIARREHSEVVIHDRHGKIRDKDSYGKDPFPPRDRKH